ncbi:Crp/Fnr family transcriptional regulator [Xylophilus sp. GOD-11R]|uniref:Crp/Fnr family transcriptional regulator n=1 Tax=Xylophilus sp. GOD-11R TaxID=3089814 RepID=UPI00298CF312|nr:Crp/Fnr family transcriptional regulator [Xylophilus sp. GOD-11R]WPB58744.1 Crp/Fnr family transcriptional regulator [Xylophilus sp. GOD-11R]
MNTPVHRSSLALRTVALLEGLSESRLARLAQDCRWHQVAARHPLLLRSADGAAARGEPEVFFIVSGRVRVAIYSAAGRQVTFRDHGPGELFGDLAAIDEGPRSADVHALEPSVVASLGRDGFLALLRDEPLVAERMLRRLAALVRELSDRVIDLSTLAVGDRLQAELLRLSREAGVSGNQARLDPAPRHAPLASRISTNREQVTRELASLTRAGLLRKEGAALVVTDVERLAGQVAAARDGSA